MAGSIKGSAVKQRADSGETGNRGGKENDKSNEIQLEALVEGDLNLLELAIADITKWIKFKREQKSNRRENKMT